MYDLEYPHITEPTPTGQLVQIVDFLWKTIENLNYVLGLLTEGNGTSTSVATAITQASSLPFAKVDTSSTSLAFTAQVPGITELRDGVCAVLVNGVATSVSGFTININGLGAKPVYLNTGTQATTEFNSAYTALFVYNSSRVSGGCWDMF